MTATHGGNAYDRKPDVFDRGIDNLMSFFHG